MNACLSRSGRAVGRSSPLGAVRCSTRRITLTAPTPAAGGHAETGSRAQQQEQRSRAALDQALTTSRADVSAAEDFVNTPAAARSARPRPRWRRPSGTLVNADAGVGGAAAPLAEAQQAAALGPGGVEPGPAGRQRVRWRRLRRRPGRGRPGRGGARRDRAGRGAQLRAPRSRRRGLGRRLRRRRFRWWAGVVGDSVGAGSPAVGGTAGAAGGSGG